MPEEELYDLQTDPWEIHNLATSAQPEHQAELKKLRAVLAQWIEDTQDQGRRLETLAELQRAELRFVPERDWRPTPGSKEAAEAEALRAAAKDKTPPAAPEPAKQKKRRKQ